ncbi:insulinase family protein [Candidatus Bathyarchaeota archaeon]|nr:insulinase family protein [Candidatus Bathyarchaeota archaeon]
MGIYIDAGSRFEDASLRGVSHIMDRLAFKSTSSHTADEVLEQIEMLGGNIQCASSREAMMYQAATFNSAVPHATAVLAETIRDPKVTDEEVAAQLDTASYELQEIWSKPEMILPELVHTAGYKDNTLGNPLLCPEERLSEIGVGTVQKYRELFYKPERMVVAFAGLEHGEAVKLAEKYFGDMKASEKPTLSRTGSETSMGSVDSSLSAASSKTSSTSQSSNIFSRVPFFKNLTTSATEPAAPLDPSVFQAAKYTGGFLTLPPAPPSPNPALPAFSHIHLAFEGLPIVSDDIYALATLQFLLGGGGSFSAGGPGKGMYSRLYTNVLNQHAWVESCLAFNHTYTDSGLFGISASCIPGRTASMLDVMCRELKSLTLDAGYAALSETEVSRAKNQLRSSLLMNLESRMVELEDLGRQVQIHGRKIPVADMCERIDALTVGDLRRVAARVFGSGAPTVVLQEAQPVGLASWEQIQAMVYGWGLGRRS